MPLIYDLYVFLIIQTLLIMQSLLKCTIPQLLRTTLKEGTLFYNNGVMSLEFEIGRDVLFPVFLYHNRFVVG